MAMVLEFNISGMTTDQYDRVIQELEASTGWFVLDVWESEEHFERFGQTLMPILMAAGVTPTEPVVRPVHNIVT